MTLAFEEGEVEIQYRYRTYSFTDTNHGKGMYKANFKDLFSYISIDMLNPTISEETFRTSVERYLSIRNNTSKCRCMIHKP